MISVQQASDSGSPRLGNSVSLSRIEVAIETRLLESLANIEENTNSLA
jgi:hypothetical protein